MQIIFTTFLVTLPALANVGGLLLLLLYIYSVLGTFLFAEVMIDSPLHDNLNFKNFITSFLTLIRISTGEAWHEVMYACTRSYSLQHQCMENPVYADYVNNNY